MRIHNIVLVGCFVMTICTGMVLASGAISTDYDSGKVSVLGEKISGMSFPPLKWNIPEVGDEITRVILRNGFVVYMYPDHSLPAEQEWAPQHRTYSRNNHRGSVADILRTRLLQR